MKKLFVSVPVLFLLLLQAGCCGVQNNSESVELSVPGWYMNPPQDADYIYFAATSVSKDKRIVIDKAYTEARSEITRTIELKLNQLQKKLEEEFGVDESKKWLKVFAGIQNEIELKGLVECEIVAEQVGKEGGYYRAYVLAKFPLGKVWEMFDKEIIERESFIGHKSSEVFKQLEEEVKKYEEWKKNK